MINKIVTEVKNEQIRAALEAVSKQPGEGRDPAYEYGLRIGYHAGLEKALQLIDRVLKDQDRDFD